MCDVEKLAIKCAKAIRARELIMQAIGQASMCWKPHPATAVFDSSAAQLVGDNLLQELLQLEAAKPEAVNHGRT